MAKGMGLVEKKLLVHGHIKHIGSITLVGFWQLMISKNIVAII